MGRIKKTAYMPQEARFFDLLIAYAKFNEQFAQFAIQLATEKFKWSPERIRYHLQKRKDGGK